MHNKYDAIVIGAGMSGMACAIRLGMFDKKVLLLESHTITGGLNSYYQRRNKEAGGIRKFDVGLHALTNYARKGERNRPLTKLLKQLRISHSELKLDQQTYSQIHFKDKTLNFNNDFEMINHQITEKFPKQVEGFKNLLGVIESFDETSLDNDYQPAKEVIRKYISDELLVEMLTAPLLIYGSAWENDMDFSQFVIMFKALYLEGFARPQGGVRTIINLLLEKMKANNVELRTKSPVSNILIKDGKTYGVVLDSGEEIHCDKVFSSMGLPETYEAVGVQKNFTPEIGKLSFVESLLIFDKPISKTDFDPTIIFYNDSNKYLYQKPDDYCDYKSAVVCFPDNYHRDDSDLTEGMCRITYMASFDKWIGFSDEEYTQHKEYVFKESLDLFKKLTPDLDVKLRSHDVFTPKTIKKFTRHLDGTVYGSTTKSRDGKTEFEGLYIIGTDQGFLGIVGAMLSGISIGNLYGLME